MTSSATDASAEGPSLIRAGSHLHSSSSCYLVEKFIGVGEFGRVARCKNVETGQTVAVKILFKADNTKDREGNMMELIGVLDSDRANLIKLYERFEDQGLSCLAFEMLDLSLFDLMERRGFKPLSVKAIRAIAQQVLVAVDSLHGLGVLHGDIKPDNIMLVDRKKNGFKAKLIDFGLATLASDIVPYETLQPPGYRAPEVCLGLPVHQVADLWGVGCVLCFLFIGRNPFWVSCEYQMMKSMVDFLGQPEDYLLSAGAFTDYFFVGGEAFDGTPWRLKTLKEFEDTNQVQVAKVSEDEPPASLHDLLDNYPATDDVEYEDRRAFVDLMRQLLHLDGDQRISASEALQHPFITMSRLAETPDATEYLAESRELMQACLRGDSVEGPEPSATPPPEPECPADAPRVTEDEGSGDGEGGAGLRDSTGLVKKTFRRLLRGISACFCCWHPTPED